ncbi:insulinase family protein [Candidatus Pacearchaeota archaeon]|nr:insulinase family protein [Candidatus Pacearchaeota archaeon]
MKKNFQKKILDNGMTVIFEKRNLPVVSVAYAVKNGGANEILDEKGISHFIEHMLFKGTEKRTSKEISEEIERNGGVLNAFTGDNITAFWCKISANNLNKALDVLTDIIKNPLFKGEELEKERKVIFEEIKMRRDFPRAYVQDKIKELLYEEPFGKDLIGDYKTMSSITKEKIFNKFKQAYAPKNLILAVVGDANFDEIIKFAEENFSKQDGEIPFFEIKKRNEIKEEKRKGLDQANLVFGYHSPLLDDKKSYAAEVLISLMGAGMSSRLFSEIREKRNLAYAVHGAAEITKDFSYSIIYVGTTKENVEKIKQLILDEFKEVAEKLSAEELESVKKMLIGNYKISMEDSQEQLVNLISYEINGNAENFYDFEKNISEVKLEDVKELSKKVAEGNYSFFALIPEE